MKIERSKEIGLQIKNHLLSKTAISHDQAKVMAVSKHLRVMFPEKWTFKMDVVKGRIKNMMSKHPDPRNGGFTHYDNVIV